MGVAAKVLVEAITVAVIVLAPVVMSLAPAWKLYAAPDDKFAITKVVFTPPTAPTEELLTL